jgi:hypothetical protein
MSCLQCLTLYFIYTYFYACETNVDLDQLKIHVVWSGSALVPSWSEITK